MVLVDIMAPTEFILPLRNQSNQLSSAKQGTIVISGGNLAYHNGSAWVQGKTAILTVISGATLTFSGGLLIAAA